ncbi:MULTISPECIES: YbaN family protein [Falsihalocynthiibacter]|uniref:YbaN family protein n=1 Tax=Falsihalocynthiibacter TaxID=2854182 RepID=UPI0030033EF6
MKTVWLILGIAALTLGIIGIALPLLPTVPFLLLAAFLFARSSENLHNWLIYHPKLGAPIQDWNEHGSINIRAKIYATLSVIFTFALSVFFDLKPLVLGIQAVCLLCVMAFLWTRPSA